MHKSKTKKCMMAIKIDLPKAYDSVDWGFLDMSLVDFGFLDQLVQLIMFCVTFMSHLEWWPIG